jgi:predicted nucleic acid-binding protein
LKIIVDTNIIFSYFWERSLTRKILETKIIEFYTLNYAIDEISKYKNEIINKSKINETKFNKIKEDIAKKIKIINLNIYKKQINKIKYIPDKKDIDFIALALELDGVLWSNDKDLKNQNYIKVFNTKEILIILNKLGYSYLFI